MVLIVLVIGLCNLALGFTLAIMLERPRVITLPAFGRTQRESHDTPARPPGPALAIEPVCEDELNGGVIPEIWLDVLEEAVTPTAAHVKVPIKAVCSEIRDYRKSIRQTEQALHNAREMNNEPSCENAITELVQHTNGWLRQLQNALDALREYESALGCDAAIGDLSLALQQQMVDGPALCDEIRSAWAQQQKVAAVQAVCQLAASVHELRDCVIETLVALTRDEECLDQFDRRQHFDPLTHLYNRLGTELIFRNWWREDGAQTRPLCVALLDVDHFAEINQKHSSRTGDRILGSVGRLLGTVASDLTDVHQVCRIGGQQFLLFFADTGLTDAVSMTDNMCQTLAAATFSITMDDIKVSLTGVAMAVAEQVRTTSLLAKLRESLVDAKRIGRGQVFAATDAGLTAAPPSDGPVESVVIPVVGNAL